ncbi:hypothetical protein TNIN_430091 [Trichonephila inaurata madagascariensis]|uniref:Uncharacterized protein n=1 Tax=Trichonephila inaurata madagascariensis TaxID=2747483 RepID=A0A8X7C4G8_9ARAC|nr:hypothetical protein TNIN_430091 [Trichonephila inaurata madagascariensis]
MTRVLIERGHRTKGDGIRYGTRGASARITSDNVRVEEDRCYRKASGLRVRKLCVVIPREMFFYEDFGGRM